MRTMRHIYRVAERGVSRSGRIVVTANALASFTTGMPVLRRLSGTRMMTTAVASPSSPPPLGDDVVNTSTNPLISHLPRRRGKIIEWNSFERCGTIADDETGEHLQISSARAFESVLPSHLRGGVKGAVVRYCVAQEPDVSDRVMIRRRTDRLTSRSYHQKPPIDFIGLAAHSTIMGGEPPTSSDKASHSPLALLDKTEEKGIVQTPLRFAHHIEVDVSTLAPNQLARCDGPLAMLGHADPDAGEVAIRPAKHLKDMRASTIFDTSTNEWLRLRRALGTAEAAEAYIQEREKRREADAKAKGRQRSVKAEQILGVVLAWSPLHRTGVIKGGEPDATLRERLRKGEEEPYDPDATDISFIRSVHCFDSALPSSRELRGRTVTFDRVQYSTLSSKTYAEHIVVVNDTDFQLQKEDVEAELPRVYIPMATPAISSALDCGVKASQSSAATPSAAVYGVITRWSGGQGVIESSSGRQFQITSAAQFNQLVDLSSHTLRGAVVSFHSEPEAPHLATCIDLLCISNECIEEVKPTLNVTRKPAPKNTAEPTGSSDAACPSDATAAEKSEDTVVGLEPDDAEWLYGTLVSWSPAEGHGIIQGDGEEKTRYVLRDVAENVIGAAKERHSGVMKLMTAGRRLQFTAYGSTGRLACNVIVLKEEASGEEVEAYQLHLNTEGGKEEESPPKLSAEGSEEAIVSPTCTSYWLQRMERAGYDVKEVSDLQNKAIAPPDDDEEAKFLDSEDLFKKDHWWTDPRKNKRFPNSQVTAGHMALMGPASMMNMAAKASDPKRLDKMVKKYQARLTEDQKAYAWEKAREMAPKYEACIRNAKAKNEEPTFHFF